MLWVSVMMLMAFITIMVVQWSILYHQCFVIPIAEWRPTEESLPNAYVWNFVGSTVLLVMDITSSFVIIRTCPYKSLLSLWWCYCGWSIDVYSLSPCDVRHCWHVLLLLFSFDDGAENKCSECCTKALEYSNSNPEAYQLMGSFLLSTQDIEVSDNGLTHVIQLLLHIL